MCSDNNWGLNPRIIVPIMDDPISIDCTYVSQDIM